MFSDSTEAGADGDAEGDTESEFANSLATGLVGGLYATVVMTAFRAPIAKSPPPPANFWATFVGSGEPSDYPLQGLALHAVYGVVSGAVFGVLSPERGGSEAEEEKRQAVQGVVYGVVLSIFGERVIVRRLLGTKLDSDERLIFHLGHLVYGLSLGAWFGSRVSE